VLDWLLSAFAALPEADIHFVGGYMANAVRERCRQIRFDFNPDWDSTGPARSLALAPLASQSATYVSYADVVFRPEIVRRLEICDADLVVAIDSTGAAATKPNRTERDARKKPRQRPHLRRRQERARTAGRECGPAHALGPHRRLMDELTRHRASRKPTAPRRHSPAQSPALRPPWWTYMGSGRLNARRTWHASSWATAES